ncbi:MAG: dihydropteroate synthase-like protein [Methanocellales archaeon]|nr:dihydropteroate synthase-like protein [Methanocellales archaeon]
MKVLVVTGRKAYQTVKKAVGDGADVLLLDVDVAAFITPDLLRSVPISNYDLILVPGLSAGDFSKLEKETGVKIRLGPKHACDLDRVLSRADSIEFSHTVPACQLLSTKKYEEAVKKANELERNAEYRFKLGDLKIGGNSMMKVMGEIVDATSMLGEELQGIACDFIAQGADIIDIGVAMDANHSEVINSVDAISHLKTPISIDTLDPDLILATLETIDIDMVLSLNSDSLKAVGKAIADQGIAAVILPDSDLESLQKNIRLAQEIGIENIIADPILRPIGDGLIDSLVAYHSFRQKSDLPLFFGVGNVTELIDADSIGINAILAGVAMELDASILFTPQYSAKTSGSISELKIAAQMMLLTRDTCTPPKDLGLDLLVVKEKRHRTSDIEINKLIKAKPHAARQDSKGFFSIALQDGKIIANHEDVSIIGTSAKAICDTISDLELVSLMEHAAYLGRELMKAELALRFGRSYAQDDEF